LLQVRTYIPRVQPVNAWRVTHMFMSTPQSMERAGRTPAQASAQWYLVHTKPLAERTAQAHLERQGYATYLPLLLQTARRREHCLQRIVPLFPRYLFLQLEAGRQSLRPVHSTIGVCNIVRFGVCCAVVRDEVVAELRSRADPVTGLHRLRTSRRLTVGTVVRITSGPFDGLEAVFERRAGGERVVVLLKLLGQDASVCVAEDSIGLCHA
jgi:transcriptional antiterminator RfaH